MLDPRLDHFVFNELNFITDSKKFNLLYKLLSYYNYMSLPKQEL